MNYYQFHIGDYVSHTARLSLMEDLAYRRLLDLYYQRERPFNGCSTRIAREIGMQEYQAEVDYILETFFPHNGENWINKRAEKEIKYFQSRINSAKKAGKASGKARRNKALERPFNDRSTPNERTLNQPTTNNQQPVTKEKNISPTGDKAKPKVSPPFSQIVEKWNSFAESHGLPKTVKRTAVIEGQIRQRWRQDMPTLEQWDNFINYIGGSKFLTGRTNGNGERPPFRCTLQWATKETNFAKIAAGEYH